MTSQWEDFLNPNVMRKRLTTAGLYLVAHEMLLSSIKEPILEFFSSEWSNTKGWHFSEEYRQEVLALDPKGKGDILRGSIKWLEKMQIIDGADVKIIEDLTEARNVFAHELRKVVSSGAAPDFDKLFVKMVGLVTKIDRWWVVNVEMAVDEQWANAEIDPKDVTPGTTLLLQILEQVVLGEDKAAWGLYHKFTNAPRTGGHNP